MASIPVNKMMFVLDVFRAQSPNTGMSKNEIHKASSLRTGIQNKEPILKAINLLQEGLILDSKKVNKQKEMITLTPLGLQIIDFINDLLRCNKSRQELKKTISEFEKNYHVDNETNNHENNMEVILKNRLLSKGWTNGEIDSYHKVRDSLYTVLHIYNSQIYNCIIHRYSLIVDEFDVNQIAQGILNKIIIDQMMQEIIIDNDDAAELQDSWSPSDYGLLSTSVLGEISKLYHNHDRFRVHVDHYLTNRFTTAAVTKLISSMLILLKPTGNVLDFVLTRELSGDRLPPDVLEGLKDRLQKTRNERNELKEITRIYKLEQEHNKEKTHSQPG
jgi:hypothetical protein